jgi:hypothetical protein
MEETERIQTTETTTAAGGVSAKYSAEVGTKAILRIRLSIGGCIGVCLLACSVSFLIESCIDFVQ